MLTLLAAILLPALVHSQSEVRGPAADRHLAWRLERAWEIGGSSDESLLLTVLSDKDLATDSRGLLYVVDRTESRIVVYDSTGRRLRTFGRKGAGPGELGAPLWVDLRSDGRLLVGDAQKNSVVVFAPDGRAEPELQLAQRLRSVRTMPGGGYIGIGSRTRDTVALLAIAGGASATLAQMPVLHAKSTPPVCGLTDYLAGPIFAPTLVWAVRGNRVVASIGAYHISVFQDTTLQRVLTRPTALRPSSQASARQHLGRGVTIQVLGRSPCTIPAAMILSVADVVPTLPAYAALVLAPDNRIWATRYTVRGEPGLADIYRVDRGYEGTVALGAVRPAAFLSSGLLVSLEMDEDDVPLIVGYRVVRD